MAVVMRKAPTKFANFVITKFLQSIESRRLGVSIETWFTERSGFRMSEIVVENFNLTFQTNATDDYILTVLLSGEFGES